MPPIRSRNKRGQFGQGFQASADKLEHCIHDGKAEQNGEDDPQHHHQVTGIRRALGPVGSSILPVHSRRSIRPERLLSGWVSTLPALACSPATGFVWEAPATGLGWEGPVVIPAATDRFYPTRRAVGIPKGFLPKGRRLTSRSPSYILTAESIDVLRSSKSFEFKTLRTALPTSLQPGQLVFSHALPPFCGMKHK